MLSAMLVVMILNRLPRKFVHASLDLHLIDIVHSQGVIGEVAPYTCQSLLQSKL